MSNVREGDIMSTEEFNQMHRDEKEREKADMQELIADAEIIRKGLENPPAFWTTLLKYYTIFRDSVHDDCFDRERLPADPMQRLVDIEVYQLTYLNMKKILNLHNHVIKKGESALKVLVERQKDEEKIEENNKSLKDPYIKR